MKPLSSIPLFVIFLPFFFVLHGIAGNFGYIDISDCLWLLLTYLLATVILYLLSFWLYKNHIRAALAVTCLLFCYFFFGAIHNFLSTHLLFLSRYKIILPVIFISLVLIWFYLKKTKATFTRATFFLNILFSIYLLVDLSEIVIKTLHPSSYKLSVYNLPVQNNYSPCDTCKDPDIYFLLFDEYASSASLKKRHHYDNSVLDSFLIHNGFNIQYGSHSNYNMTPVSMASILNMGYLLGITNPNAFDVSDYAYCNELIRNNEVIRYLSSRSYEIVNYSIFELAGNPSLVNQTLLPLKTNLITEFTLPACIKRDIGFHFPPALLKLKWLFKNPEFGTLDNNNLFIQKVKTESSVSASHPRFIYAHFEMPHFPFYYDSNGRLKDTKLVHGFNELYSHPDRYIQDYKDYLPYTNSKIRELITTIQQNTHHNAVIILMGDHGLRCDLPGQDKSNYFENQNAIFFPDRDYHLLYDSISGINQFRVVFNKLFRQRLPLLADSVIFLTDKK